MQSKLLQRPIPSTGEQIPIVGVGTWQTFDVTGSDEERTRLTAVLKAMIAGGSSVIDSSPMYGRSEEMAGKLAADTGLTRSLFVATKVWTTGKKEGIEQMERSISLLGKKPIDLMQIHNLVDWKTHLETLKQWKAEGRVRYIGYTHYTDSSHAELISAMKTFKPDFVQANYHILDRHAEESLLPWAKDHGVAMLANRPFGEGVLFRKVKGRTVPDWAKEAGIDSWARYFLKFIVSHPAVTCVIPGTSRVDHLLDNLGAGSGPLPDTALRNRMAKELE